MTSGKPSSKSWKSLANPLKDKEAISYLGSLEEGRINLGLSRIKKLLSYLGNPHQCLKAVHIAGTNGKGSVAAMLASILSESGYKVGLYTSPHLRNFRERILIRKKTKFSAKSFFIPAKKLTQIVKKIRPLVNKIAKTNLSSPTFFEVTTAIALYYFALEKVDFAVLEVGLGGRLDATNVISPLASIITSISLEHTDRLGKTLGKIAYEKCGIIKKNIPVITAAQSPKVLAVIRKKCKEKASPLFLLRKENYALRKFSLQGQFFDYKSREIKKSQGSPRFKLKNLFIPLIGRHQLANAALAIAAIEILFNHLSLFSSIRKGLRQVCWPGRAQLIGRRPYILIDGAHNPAAAQVLRKVIEEYFLFPGAGRQVCHKQKRRRKRRAEVYLVFAAMKDKDIKGMLQALLPITNYLILARSKAIRAANPQEIFSLLQKERSIPKKDLKISIIENVRQALAYARRLAHPQDLICVTGSLYTIAEILPQ